MEYAGDGEGEGEVEGRDGRAEPPPPVLPRGGGDAGARGVLSCITMHVKAKY